LIVRIMRELGIQAIWVTHNESVSSGNLDIEGAKILKLSLDGDKTVCETVRTTNGSTPQPA
jgi:hypothetical protein